MAARDLIEVGATGDVTTQDSVVHSIVLTAGADTATLAVKDGSGGATRLTLSAVANTSAVWTAGAGVHFDTAVHATLTGTSPTASFEVE